MKIQYMSDTVVVAQFAMKEQIPDGINTVMAEQIPMNLYTSTVAVSLPKIKLYKKSHTYFGAERGTVEAVFIYKGA